MGLYLTLIFVVLIVILLYTLWSINKLKSENNLLEISNKKLQSEKMKLLQSIHNDIGQSLILLNKKEVISKNEIEELYKRVRRISSNHYENDLTDLKISLELLNKKIENNSDFALISKIEISKNINDELKKDVYSCLQELLNNSLKYSNGKRVNYELIQVNHLLTISYKDFSKEIQTSEINKGVGLQFLELTAKKWKGSFLYENTENGVDAKLTFKI